MPKIPFKVDNFPQPPLPKSVPTDFDVSRLQLVTEAIRVGDSSNVGGYHRPFSERLWRATMMFAFLEERKRDEGLFWARSQAFVELDPSEKTAVSFLLGLVQASILTKRLVGLSDIVHVDALLKLRKIPRSGRRPDLVGFDPSGAIPGGHGRVLIEAKGRSEATRSVVNTALESAKEQLREFDDDFNWNVAYALIGADPMLIASVGHFTTAGYWEGALDDPPPARDGEPPLVEDEAFQGLLNLASLRPVVDTLAEIREYAPAQFTRVKDGMTFARLPGIDVALGLPTQVYDEVEAITGRGGVPRVIEDDQAAEWAMGRAGRANRVGMYREQLSENYANDFADFYLDNDGVLAAQIRSDEDPDSDMREVEDPEMGT